MLVYGRAELQESSVTRLLPNYRVSCSEPLIEQLRMKEILKKDSNIIRKNICHPGFMTKCFQVLKEISTVRTGVCVDMNSIFAPGKTTGYSSNDYK